MARRVGLAAVLVLLAALGGCATHVEGSSDADLFVAGGPYGDPCDPGDGTTPPSPAPEETLTDGAHLTLATRCIFNTEPVPGDGEWSVRQDQQATSGLDALGAALRLPSKEDQDPGTFCPAIGYLPIVITVTEDTGRSFHPAIPHESCGGPLKAVTDAIAALPWTTTASTRLQQVRTELEVTSGCSGQYKPVVAIVALEESSQNNRYTVDTNPGELKACSYDIGSDDMGLVGGVMVHTGVLTAASTLPPDHAHELLAAVDSAPLAVACDRQESSFAVISGVKTSLTVELAGCYRAWVDGDSQLRQLDGALVARLLG